MIQIHLMLLLIFLSWLEFSTPSQDSNTSHVTINLTTKEKVPSPISYSNTSHVTINLPPESNANYAFIYSNTSHVTINRMQGYRQKRPAHIQIHLMLLLILHV